MTQAWPSSYRGGFGEHVATARPVEVLCGILLGRRGCTAGRMGPGAGRAGLSRSSQGKSRLGMKPTWERGARDRPAHQDDVSCLWNQNSPEPNKRPLMPKPVPVPFSSPGAGTQPLGGRAGLPGESAIGYFRS